MRNRKRDQERGPILANIQPVDPPQVFANMGQDKVYLVGYADHKLMGRVALVTFTPENKASWVTLPQFVKFVPISDDEINAETLAAIEKELAVTKADAPIELTASQTEGDGWTDEDFDELAESVIDPDVQRACIQDWRDTVPAEYQNLLEAE